MEASLDTILIFLGSGFGGIWGSVVGDIVNFLRERGFRSGRFESRRHDDSEGSRKGV